SGEITWAHFVWKEGQKEWERICDIATFKAAVPPPPTQKPQARPPAPPVQGKVQPKEWFLFANDSQTGPYTADEVKSMVAVGKIGAESFVWKDGMKDWEKISTVPELASAAAGGSKPP